MTTRKRKTKVKVEAAPARTGEKQEATQFKPGQSGNPKGRPPGSKDRLKDAFIADLCADWEKNGAAVIVTVRTEKPSDYLKVVASVLPKDLDVNVNRFDTMTDEQITNAVSAALREARALGIDIGVGIAGSLH